MKLKSTNNVETNRYELEIVIDGQEYTDAVDKATKRGLAKITVPGFRKGHAPKAMVLKMFGADMFYQDALEALYPKAVDDAIDESGLELADQKVDFELVSLDENGADFKIKVTVKPEVKLGDYKGLKVEREVVSVTADEIEREIDALKEKNARIVTVTDREAKDGDITVIDFEGFEGGKAFEGGKGENYELTLGSGTFIPGFEDQIVGHKVDDEFDVNVTFPEEYQAEELAGKEAVFKVKLHEIKVKEYPEVDDEFAKDVSEFDTLKELKADLKKKITDERKTAAQHAFEDALMQKVADGIEADIPEDMVVLQSQRMMDNFKQQLAAQGIPFDQYVKMTGMDEDAIQKQSMEPALKQVRMDLAVSAIVKAENLEASDEEVENEMKTIAEKYGMDLESIKKYLPASEVKEQVIREKVIKVVADSAVAVEPEEKAEEKSEDKAEEKKEDKE